jgi:acyl carrier protein
MPADQSEILAEVVAMLCAIRDDLDTGVVITFDSTFRGDLGIESIDVVALAGRLQSRYGSAVNFPQFVAGLELESLTDLTVGDLTRFIGDSLEKVAA